MFPFDQHPNFAYEIVSNSPGTAGTAIVIGTSSYAQFPDPGTSSAYNAVVWPGGTIPLASNAEIVRVVGKATAGTLYVTRNQESSSNRNIASGDQFAVAVTNKAIDDIEDVNYSGWLSVPNTMTYASGSTVTMVGDFTSNFFKGVKVKMVQGGTTEHFYCFNSAVASGTTTLTFAGDSGTPVANAAISNTYLSYAQSPQGFPTVFNWTPSFTGFSGNPTGVYRYFLSGNVVTIICDQSADGTSNANSFWMTLPVPMDDAFTEQRGLVTATRDNTALNTVPGMWLIAGTAPATMQIHRDQVQTAWTTSGGKRFRGLQGSYLS